MLRPSGLAILKAEQPPVAGELMLEAQVHLEMAALFPDAVVIFLAVAENLEKFGLRFPLLGRCVENLQIPISLHFVGAVRILKLARHFDDGCRIDGSCAQIGLDQRRSGWPNGAHRKPGEALPRDGEGNGGKKLPEALELDFGAEFRAPDACVSVIGHRSIIASSRG